LDVSGRNGADIGQVVAMLGDVLAGQAEIRAELRDHSRQLADLNSGMVSLRQTVTEYHSAVLGHGILISNLEDRVRRIEAHLNLPPAA
jgi:hypothetical protein